MAHSHHHHHHNDSTGNIRLAFFVNLLFAAIELVGGLYTNSVAILSDALHDFGDSISLAIAWYLQKVSKKGRDKNYSYGYKRFSLLGAIFISVILLVGSVFVIRECVERLFNPQEPNAQGMFLLAILGVAVNGFAVLRLKKGTSINERTVTLHMMEDVLGWIAVLVVSIVMMFVYLPILDPLLSIGISIWILFNIYRNLKATFHVLLQHVPEGVEQEKLEERIRSLKHVISLHDIHLWTLDGEENIMTLHVVIDTALTQEQQKELKHTIRRLCDEVHIHHVTIEFEAVGEVCELSDCQQV